VTAGGSERVEPPFPDPALQSRRRDLAMRRRLAAGQRGARRRIRWFLRIFHFKESVSPAGSRKVKFCGCVAMDLEFC